MCDSSAGRRALKLENTGLSAKNEECDGKKSTDSSWVSVGLVIYEQMPMSTRMGYIRH